MLPGVMTTIKDRFCGWVRPAGGLQPDATSHNPINNTHNRTPFKYRRTPSQITVTFKGR